MATMNSSQDVTKGGKPMSDGIVILGTVAIVGLVAVVTVALVYNRSLWVRGTRDQVEVQTSTTVVTPERQAQRDETPRRDK
jgi:hypothetical protein